MRTKIESMIGPERVARRYGLTLKLTNEDLLELLRHEAVAEGRPIPGWALPSVTADNGWPRFFALLNRAETMVKMVENPENIVVAVPVEGTEYSNSTIQACSRVSFAMQAIADFSMLIELVSRHT